MSENFVTFAVFIQLEDDLYLNKNIHESFKPQEINKLFLRTFRIDETSKMMDGSNLGNKKLNYGHKIVGKARHRTRKKIRADSLGKTEKIKNDKKKDRKSLKIGPF